MTKLWQKGYELDKQIEDFTVGDDFLLDEKLLKYDIKVNLAHAKLLAAIGIMSQKELKDVENALKELEGLAEKGKFKIKKEQEDIHTAVEDFLTEKLGKTGKKIHTGKSRNDQVMADVLLYCKDKLVEVKKLISTLMTEMETFSKKNAKLPMPGYTHMQKAMPYSVDKWMLSFKEMLEDDEKAIENTLDLIDKSPMGSAAGYGTTLGLDKEQIAKELGFGSVYENALYVQNSKGKYELMVLNALNQAMMTMNKLANDLLLFTTAEFNYFKLPNEFCTGSSIMPQKKNYDVLELVKGKTKVVQAKAFEVSLLYSNLMSGYNRDLQLIKKPLMEGIEIAKSILTVMALVVKNLEPNKKKLKEAMTPELYATEKALELVKKGMPFRDAYKTVAKTLK